MDRTVGNQASQTKENPTLHWKMNSLYWTVEEHEYDLPCYMHIIVI